MNISLTVKTPNMRSFNLSNKDGFFKNKVKAATLERDNILLLTNTQVRNKSNYISFKMKTKSIFFLMEENIIESLGIQPQQLE